MPPIGVEQELVPFKRHGLADSVPLLPQNAAKSDSLLLWRTTAQVCVKSSGHLHLRIRTADFLLQALESRWEQRGGRAVGIGKGIDEEEDDAGKNPEDR